MNQKVQLVGLYTSYVAENAGPNDDDLNQLPSNGEGYS